jgi:hypothetical protein
MRGHYRTDLFVRELMRQCTPYVRLFLLNVVHRGHRHSLENDGSVVAIALYRCVHRLHPTIELAVRKVAVGDEFQSICPYVIGVFQSDALVGACLLHRVHLCRLLHVHNLSDLKVAQVR